MTPQLLQKLIGLNEAQVGYWSSGAGLMLLEVPNGKAVVITRIMIHAFADLPADTDFTDTETVAQYTWHQLRVIGDKGISAFHARHDLRQVPAADQGTAIIPVGITTIDTFINQADNILFELTHFSPGTSMNISVGLLPTTVKFPTNVPVPPAGYGRQQVAGSINTVSSLRAGVNDYEIKMFGSSQVGALTRNSNTSLQWPVNANTALNAPQFAIEYGYLTQPIIQVEYVIVNKNTSAKFSGSV